MNPRMLPRRSDTEMSPGRTMPSMRGLGDDQGLPNKVGDNCDSRRKLTDAGK